MTETVVRPIPSAVPPTETELAAWRALSRDAQLARYREALLAPEAARVSQASMADVLTAARQRGAGRDREAKRAVQMQELVTLKADIDKGLANLAAGRIANFDAERIIERGRQLLARRFRSA